MTVANAAPPSPQKDIVKNAQSDYDRVFLPFSLPPSAVLAPSNALLANPEDFTAAQSRLDDILTHREVDMDMETCDTIRSYFPTCRRGLETTTITEIVDRVNASADNPIDLTEVQKEEPLDLLKKIPMKYLHFGEDVRPPYYGTYTKVHDPFQERKVARNPIYRGLDDLSYDYDSEAEWEEPGEGEDLDSEGEEDLEEDGDEDLDGFLDDDEDPEVKRRLLNGDQEPVSTGLCWEDTSGVSRLNDGSGAISTEFKDFKLGFLLREWSLLLNVDHMLIYHRNPSAHRSIFRGLLGSGTFGSPIKHSGFRQRISVLRSDGPASSPSDLTSCEWSSQHLE